MLCGWEGSRRSGVALAMRHRLGGLSTYGLNSYGKGDERPTYALEGHGTLFLYLLLTHRTRFKTDLQYHTCFICQTWRMLFIQK